MARTGLDFPSLPARSLEDLRVPDDAVMIDNEIAKRSDEATMDLAKWALLGIAGYGFLLKEIAMANSTGLLACQRYAVFLIGGAGLLAAAAALALVGKERLIRCATYQTSILRSLKKLANGGWTEQEAALIKEDLAHYRVIQKANIIIAARCVRLAHGLLAAGGVVTVICFALVLISLRPAPHT